MSDETSLGESVLVLTTDNNGFRMGIEDAHAAANAMQANLDRMQDHVKDLFAEKFEHVGVHLFGMDMLRTIGITEGARPILGALQLGVSQLGDAFGVAAGAMGLMTFGLTALAAIAFKVYEAHEKHTESLETNLKALNAGVGAIDDYIAAGGRLSESLKAVKKDTDDQIASTIKSIEANTKAALAEEEKALAYYKSIDVGLGSTTLMERYGLTVKNVTDLVDAHTKKVNDLSATLEANQHGFATVDEYVKAGTQSLKDNAEAVKKDAEAFDAWNKKIDEQIAKEEAAGRKWEESSKRAGDAITKLSNLTQEEEQDAAAATTSAYDKRKAEIEKYRIAKQAEIEKLHEVALANAVTDQQRLQADKAYTDASISLQRAIAAKTFENYTLIGQEASKLGQTMSTSFANAAGSAIASGKSMHDDWIQISKQIKAQLVADTIEAGIQYGIQAVKGVFMHNAIAAASTASAAAQIKADTAVIASTHAKIAAVATLATTLGVAEKAATALDIALAAAA